MGLSIYGYALKRNRTVNLRFDHRTNCKRNKFVKNIQLDVTQITYQTYIYIHLIKGSLQKALTKLGILQIITLTAIVYLSRASWRLERRIHPSTRLRDLFFVKSRVFYTYDWAEKFWHLGLKLKTRYVVRGFPTANKNRSDTNKDKRFKNLKNTIIALCMLESNFSQDLLSLTAMFDFKSLKHQPKLSS